MSAYHLLAAGACVLVFVVMSAASRAGEPTPPDANTLPNVYFAMDTGLRDGKNTSPAQRAETLATLGYVGSDTTGNKAVPETVKAYDAKGLRLFGAYNWMSIDADWQPDEDFERALKALKGRDAWIWVAMGSKKHKPSDPAGDDAAVAILRKMADQAAPYGVRIVLYPHTNAWLERVEDTVRVARKADRKNVGGTFNLCHFLQVDGDEARLPKLLKDSMDKLFVVTINGADSGAKGWAHLIQPLGRGTFDIDRLLRTLHAIGYAGPVGEQSYGIKGPSRALLGECLSAWNSLKVQACLPRVDFTGTDLSAFRKPTGDWLVVGEVSKDRDNERRLTWKPGTGVVVNGRDGRTKHLVTKAEHGDCRAHIEFMVPKGSNSGVYFQGRYEIQVLDSWGKKKVGSGDCGGIYERWKDGKGFEGTPPDVNASRPPGEWQTYDVWFRAPRFDKAGKKTANARFLKVIHNGKVVHENVEVTGPTRSALFDDEKPTGPLMLQGDHGPVAYRNCWMVLGDVPVPTGPDKRIPLAGEKPARTPQERQVVICVSRGAFLPIASTAVGRYNTDLCHYDRIAARHTRSPDMGHRRERLDNRLEKQKITREKNSLKKNKERARREARVAAREERRTADAPKAEAPKKAPKKAAKKAEKAEEKD